MAPALQFRSGLRGKVLVHTLILIFLTLAANLLAESPDHFEREHFERHHRRDSERERFVERYGTATRLAPAVEEKINSEIVRMFPNEKRYELRNLLERILLSDQEDYVYDDLIAMAPRTFMEKHFVQANTFGMVESERKRLQLRFNLAKGGYHVKDLIRLVSKPGDITVTFRLEKDLSRTLGEDWVKENLKGRTVNKANLLKALQQPEVAEGISVQTVLEILKLSRQPDEPTELG